MSKESIRLRNLLLRLSKGYLSLEKAMMSQCCKLNASSAYILEALGRLGPTTPGELAEELGLAPSTVTRQLDAVAREGLIERTSRETDRRVQQLSLTPAGRRMLSTLQTASQEVTKRLIRRIPNGAMPWVFEALSLLARAVGEELGTDWEESIVDEKAIQHKVSEKYSLLTASVAGCCCQPHTGECTSKAPISSDLYSSEEAAALPAEALSI
ncbi:MAG: MarR family transcriptional regulator [Bacillota bacterium]